MATLPIREYRSGDADAMYALDLVCFDAPFRFSRRAMRAFAEARGTISLLAIEGERELAGFVIVQEEGRRGARYGYVVTLDVAPSWRRSGLASRLMREAELRLRERKAEQIALHVHTENEAAVRFYEQSGYERVSVEADFYGAGRNAFVYSKRL